jgi:putative PIN family toxin of toxin-antitoxin system
VRVTADSNIYVSGILFGGKPLTLLKLGHARRIRLFISDDIIDETLGVLREKFKRSRESIIVAEEFVRVCTYEVAPTERLNVVPDDEDDNRVIECAVAGGCEYVVTGDTDLLRLETYRDIAILRVSDFLNRFADQPGPDPS